MKDDELRNSFNEAVQKTLLSVGEGFHFYEKIQENSSGTPSSFTSVTSSENREKLSKFYTYLNNVYGDRFDIRFNQSFISILGRNDTEVAGLYQELYSRYSKEWSFVLDRGRVVVRPYRHPENDDTYEPDKGYRSDAEGQQIKESNESEGLIDSKTLSKNFASMIGFLKTKGLKLDPLPDIVLNKQKQSNGLLDKTGQYDPEKNVIEIFTYGRHPKDILRSGIHELFHCHQNNCNRIKDIHTEKVSEDDNLKDIEGECFREGNLLYREWLETLGGYQG